MYTVQFWGESLTDIAIKVNKQKFKNTTQYGDHTQYISLGNYFVPPNLKNKQRIGKKKFIPSDVVYSYRRINNGLVWVKQINSFRGKRNMLYVGYLGQM